jgi:hypothetical protein
LKLLPFDEPLDDEAWRRCANWYDRGPAFRNDEPLAARRCLRREADMIAVTAWANGWIVLMVAMSGEVEI